VRIPVGQNRAKKCKQVSAVGASKQHSSSVQLTISMRNSNVSWQVAAAKTIAPTNTTMRTPADMRVATSKRNGVSVTAQAHAEAAGLFSPPKPRAAHHLDAATSLHLGGNPWGGGGKANNWVCHQPS